MTESLYWVWLQQRIGYASRYAAKAAKLPGGARFIHDCPQEDLRALDVFPQSVLRRLEDRDLTAANDIIELCKDNNYSIITIDSEKYPQRLRGITDPPLVLYVKGDLPDIDVNVSIGIVGTRSASDRGLAAAQELGRRLAAAGAIIISGCAMGVDMYAQQGAIMAEGGLTVGVLGCGLDIKYNQRSSALRELIPLHGALISEYPPGTEVRKEYFPQRNRIISGLSLGVAVIEAGAHSGSAITARRAVEQGRDLFALPGPAGTENAEGVNGLIACGAKPFFSPADILIEYEKDYQEKIHFEGTRFPLLGNPGDGELSAERVLRRGIARNNARKNAAAQQPKMKSPSLFEMAEKAESEKKEAQQNVLSSTDFVPLTAPEAVSSAAEEQAEQPEKFVLPKDLSPEARAVYDAMSAAPEQIDELAKRLGKSLPEISMLIFELEMEKAVISHPGKRFSRRETK